MAELHVLVEDQFLQSLQERLGYGCKTQLARDAFTLLHWAVEERLAGRRIASTQDG